MPNMKSLSLTIKKLWPMLKFSKVGQRSRSMSQVQNLWFHWKGLVIRIIHATYERLISKNNKTCVCKTQMRPAATKLKYGKYLLVLYFDPAPHPGACHVSEV